MFAFIGGLTSAKKGQRGGAMSGCGAKEEAQA